MYPWAAASCAGIVEILITFPIEYVKTQLQLSALPGKASTASAAETVRALPGTGVMTVRSCVEETFQRRGCLGFYKGLTP